MTASSPRPTNTNANSSEPAVWMSIIELLYIVTVTTAMAAVLLPAINDASYSNYKPMPFPWLVPFYEGHIWRFVIAVTLIGTGSAAALLIVIHPRLPSWFRQRFPWRHSRRTKPGR